MHQYDPALPPYARMHCTMLVSQLRERHLLAKQQNIIEVFKFHIKKQQISEPHLNNQR